MKRPPKQVYVVVRSAEDGSSIVPLDVCRTKRGAERVMAGWRAEITTLHGNDWLLDDRGVWVSFDHNGQIFTKICNYHET